MSIGDNVPDLQAEGLLYGRLGMRSRAGLFACSNKVNR